MVTNTTRSPDAYELDQTLSTTEYDEWDFPDNSFEDEDSRGHLLSAQSFPHSSQPSSIRSVVGLLTNTIRNRILGVRIGTRHSSVRRRRPRSWFKPVVIRRILLTTVGCTCAITLLLTLLFPSYTSPPAHYATVRARIRAAEQPGAGNPENHKVFIAASIFDRDGTLASGHWGQNVLELIYLLGPQNTYLSIYENDAGPTAQAALASLSERVQCEHTLRFEEHLRLDEVSHVTLPDGSDRVKRIEYLAEVRNRALAPLQTSHVQYDRLLYVNDVVFDPVDAVQLLFSTHVDHNGRADYRAACAVDFINPLKFYDTFALRDYEGYGIGLPLFPWFTTAGKGVSRRDVLAGSDAVRVRSCWGGMVAFDAQYFQPMPDTHTVPSTAGDNSPSNISMPIKFRAEPELYWDASECCLIHADLQSPDPTTPGIYMNPYVRVAYDWNTLSWLGLSRRFEKIFIPIHYCISRIIGMPWANSRRAERPWDKVMDRIWVPHAGDGVEVGAGGSFETKERVASHSGFCGREALQVLKTDITQGEKNWEFLPLPS